MGCEEQREGRRFVRASYPGGRVKLEVSRAGFSEVGYRMPFLPGTPSSFPFSDKQLI